MWDMGNIKFSMPDGASNCGTDHVFVQSHPVTPSSTAINANALEYMMVTLPVNGKSIERKKQSSTWKSFPEESEREGKQSL